MSDHRRISLVPVVVAKPWEVEFKAVLHRLLAGWRDGTDVVFLTVCDLAGRANQVEFRPRTDEPDGRCCPGCWPPK